MTQEISKHFRRSEFECNDGCGYDTVDAELLAVLERARRHFNVPITINSGCRCQAHNTRSGGSVGSQHMFARAADIVVSGVDPASVADYFDQKYPYKYGVGRYATFTHIDTRTGGPARWSG